MALIEPIGEKAFKQMAKRLLQVLKSQNPDASPAPTLAFAQETLCKMSGLGSLHALQKQWAANGLPIKTPSALPDLATANGDMMSICGGNDQDVTANLDLKWGAEQEKAWRALPLLYRLDENNDNIEVPLNDLKERAVRLRGWRESDPLWRDAILQHEAQPTAVFLVWAKAHPQAANALGWWPGTWETFDASDRMYFDFSPRMWLLAERFLFRDFDLYEKLIKQAGWPTFIGMRHQIVSGQEEIKVRFLWDRPHQQQQRLLGLLSDHELGKVCLALGNQVHNMNTGGNTLTSPIERKDHVRPLMQSLGARVEKSTDFDFLMAWEYLVTELYTNFFGYRVSVDHEIYGITDNTWRQTCARLPRFFTFENGGEPETFSNWSKQQLFDRQSKAWQEALTLLSADSTAQAVQAWTQWLIQQGDQAAQIFGALANRPHGVPLAYVARAAGKLFYRAWLEAGLPAALGQGAAAWKTLEQKTV
jgi:hypothetical protein